MLEPVDGDPVVDRVPDPGSLGSGRPAALSPAWVEQHAHEVDLVHLHFGFDALTPAELTAWTGALRRHRLPLVLTVHDLRNPHHREPGPLEQQLDVLVPAADALLTLTGRAADLVQRRWGRRADVLPHPHVVPVERLGRARPPRTEPGLTVGLDLKSLRANVSALPVTLAAVEAVRTVPGARLLVGLHREVLEPGFPRADPELVETLRRLHDEGAIELRLRDRLGDDELLDHLSRLDVSVLPYAFGTHSGWVELCHDLGTQVVAPRLGCWHDQRELLGYDVVDGVPDVTQLAEALQLAAGRTPAPADRVERLRERADVVAAHHALYRRLVGQRGGSDLDGDRRPA
ncbi:glycosyltransferase [Angustibacter aerolatus]